MSDSISEAFDKKFGTQSAPKWEQGMRNRLGLFHAFVIEQFGENEISSGDISSRMKQLLGVKLSNYFGCSISKIVDSDEFKVMFNVVKGENGLIKIKAILPVRVSYAGDGLREQMGLVSLRKLKLRDDAPRIVGRTNEVKSKFDLDQYFFGSFISNYKGSQGFAVPAVLVTFIEKIGAQFGNVVPLDNRYAKAAYRGEFVIGRGDTSGAPVLLDISRRAILIRCWSDFAEARSMDFETALRKGIVTVTLNAHLAVYREIMIYESGKLYAGFYLQNQNRRSASYIAREVRVSKVAYDGFRELGSLFDFCGYNGIVTNGREQLHIGIPNKERWQSTDAFCADDEIWEGLTIEEPKSEIPKTTLVSVANGTIDENVAMVDGGLGDVNALMVHGANDSEKSDAQNLAYCNCSDAERSFVRNLIAAIQDAGFVYDSRDVVRFHTSVKTGMFTLLGGAPGSGKSSLSAIYARALLGESILMPEKGYLTVDVNPAWTEPDDLLGYWNLQNAYIPSASGLVPFLRMADAREKISLVCLEEMNLARVEHYFASFIQAFSRVAEERILPGVPARDDMDRDHNLVLPESVRFIGTNNFDETTQQISSRFYDRCNYIELREIERANPFESKIPNAGAVSFDFPVSCKDYLSWTSMDGIAPVSESVKNKYRELLPFFRELGLAPSPRVEFAIRVYIANRPFAGVESAPVITKEAADMIAFDEAVAQRVLPKYRPNLMSDEHLNCKNLEKHLEGMELSLGLFKGIQKRFEMPVR